MPTAPTSSSEFLDLLSRSGLLSAERIASLSDLGLPDEPQKAAGKLVAQGFLTRFQAQQLLAGRHKGFRIGGYLIKDMLGRGGMGAVYLAEHLELHRKVAVKVLVPGRDEDQNLALERFLREARAAAALDHPNIVRIFDVARYNEVPFLVMEYVEGETLQQVLDRDGAIPYPIAAEYIAQAAAGLQHAHEKGFIHRDIKPGNLMRDKSGTIKILDMGLARSANNADNVTERLDNGAVVGTADFIAPEQALNQPNIDGRSDIYSLGATFFALIIGKPPFEGNTTQKLLQHQLRSAPKLATLDSSLPKGLSAVVAKMLAKKPEDRYQTPAEVIAALAPWMGNSSRILAGISRTNLAQGASLQETLAEIARSGSSRRLNTGTSEDAEDVDVESCRETGAVASSITTRERVRRAKEPLSNRKKLYLYAAIAVGVSILGVLGAWALSGGSKKPSTDNHNPQEPEQPKPVTPSTNPPKSTTGNPPIKPASTHESIVYQFDPAEIQPFKVRLRGASVADGKRGTLPHGVSIYALKNDTEAEFEAGKIDGVSAFTITRHSATTGAQLAFELEREAAAQGLGLKLKPDAEYRVRVQYRASGAAQLAVSVHTLAYMSLQGGYRQFLATGNQWKTAEVTIRRPSDPLRLVVEAQGPPDNPVSIGPIALFEITPEKNK